MKLVIAHDYLIQMGGAERVVAAMHRRFPAAPIYTSAVSRDTLWDDFDNADIRTSILQHAPAIEDHVHFKKYFPLFALAFRSFGHIEADCAWISSSTFAKFLRFAPGTRTVCYIHSPTRFLWQSDDYLSHEITNSALETIVRATLPTLRALDRLAALRMDVLVANSRNVQERIRRYYGLDSIVIYPPVQIHRFSVSPKHDGTYLIVSRLLGYKNIDLAVRAFTSCGRKLVIIGEGPDRSVLEKQAGDSVKFLGRLSEIETLKYFERCRAMIVPGHEDFAISPVEAMAAGKPIIAMKEGGALETVVDGETGLFFAEDTEESLLEAVDRFEAMFWDAEHIRLRAEEFSEERFLDQTEALLRSHVEGIPPGVAKTLATANAEGANRRDLSERGIRRRETFGELLHCLQSSGLKSEEARGYLLGVLKGWTSESEASSEHEDRSEKIFGELLDYLTAAGIDSELAKEKLQEVLDCWQTTP